MTEKASTSTMTGAARPQGAGRRWAATLGGPVVPKEGLRFGARARDGASALATLLVLFGFVAPLEANQTEPARSQAPDSLAEDRVNASLGKLPLYFIENRGQLDARVAYYVKGSGTSVYFTSQGVTFALSEALASGSQASGLDEPAAPSRRRWAVKLDFLGANPNARPSTRRPITRNGR